MAAVESRAWEPCSLIGHSEVGAGVAVLGISYSSSGTHECVVQGCAEELLQACPGGSLILASGFLGL